MIFAMSVYHMHHYFNVYFYWFHKIINIFINSILCYFCRQKPVIRGLHRRISFLKDFPPKCLGKNNQNILKKRKKTTPKISSCCTEGKCQALRGVGVPNGVHAPPQQSTRSRCSLQPRRFPSTASHPTAWRAQLVSIFQSPPVLEAWLTAIPRCQTALHAFVYLKKISHL